MTLLYHYDIKFKLVSFYPLDVVSRIFATATCLSVCLSQPVLCLND